MSRPAGSTCASTRPNSPAGVPNGRRQRRATSAPSPRSTSAMSRRPTRAATSTFSTGVALWPSPPSIEAVMTDIDNRFKRWLKGEGPRPPLGTWLMAAAPATAEAMGHTGFDFLVVDMEHVPIEVSDLAGLLRAVGCTRAEPVVRLAWNDQVLVKRVL